MQFRHLDMPLLKEYLLSQIFYSMAEFDEGFNYQIVYEVGGLKGYSLYVDGREANKK